MARSSRALARTKVAPGRRVLRAIVPGGDGPVATPGATAADDGDLAPLSPLLPLASSRSKRAFDIVAAGVAILAFAPLMLMVSLSIWLEDGGRVLFRQERSGLGGRVFSIYKFRTMRMSDPDMDVRQALPADARVTGVGRVLRRLSLDELPQLLNVLQGDMSLVGPRPHALSHDRLWGETVPGYAGRFRAKPGLTGRAQVLGLRGLVSTPDCIARRVAADNLYIEDWTFRSDVGFVLRTIPILFGDPAAF